MRRNFYCLILLPVFCCLQFMYGQQISIQDGMSPQQLIQDHLIQGCVETSNISSPVNGSVNGFSSYGYFEKANSDFPFENGIVLSTGNAISGGNVVNTAVLHEGQNDWTTDPDLETALGINNTLNATSIEFDFSSSSNLIQFNYILASEEYFGNFPCNYSDGFALLIKQAGTSDPYVNIAVIPGTTIPVNTNTIHPEIVGFCPASNPEYFDGYNMGDTNFNGRTHVLTASASITPNVTYNIKLIIADQTDKNYDSAVFIQGNSFNASVDLGEDLVTCADDVILNADIENPEATYTWLHNSGVIAGETQPTLAVTQSGTYTVSIAIPLAGNTCIIEDTIEIVLSATQPAEPISNYEICDDNNDGLETFDLATKTNEILASVPPSNYNVSYHFSNVDAVNNNNPITNPIQNSSNPQTIHVRIEDLDNGCLAYSTFDLIVNPIPNITPPTDLMVCDDQTADGITQIDLSVKDDEITAGNSDLVVSYHTSQADANQGINAIPLPFVNTNPTEQLFVRVVNSETGCVAFTTLNVMVMNNPVINMADHYIDACDIEHDGFANFDLTSITPDVLQGLTGVSVTFHETEEDALTGANPIVNDTDYANTEFEEQLVYIRVEDDATGCASVTPIEIHPNLLLTGTRIRDFGLCDLDGDGSEFFDLMDIAEVIINELPDVEIIFYETIEDQNNQVNALDITEPYEVIVGPVTLFITLVSPTCTEVAEIQLNLNPVDAFPSIGGVTYCDTDQDGLTTVDLHSFDHLIVNEETGYSVTYFETEEDAENNNNPLPAFYDNISNPQTLYVRITSDAFGCADVSNFTLNILDAPVTTQPSDIVICDNDQDGFSIVNLDAKISEIVSDTSNRTITFHNLLEDAENDVNPISNTVNYNADTQTVFVRVENNESSCHAMESFEIIVNTLPSFVAINNYRICEEETDDIGDFIFNTKDAEILNGQTDKQVLYFETQADADNRTNIINKNVAYQNTSNPQIIYARVENLSDEDCYGTTSFTIEIGTNPDFNQPTNWFVCDDISNDGSALWDLNTKIDEISAGIAEDLTITFHNTLNQAQNGTNPLPLNYTNNVNPKQVYVRIDNGTICNSITSFTLNVIQAPDANPATPLITCDDDYDGVVTFDITQAEFDILDVRQDNITISYFETIADLDAQTNPIQNPSNYQNISNPQTVYVRVTNTISDCYLAIPLELIVNLPPAINDFGSVQICDNEENYFDLNTVDNLLVDNTSNTTITYHSSPSDAENGTNAMDTDFNYSSNNTTFHVRVANSTTLCFVTYAFHLRVNPIPSAFTPEDLEHCDDDFDGFYLFDLSQQTATVLGSQNPANFTVTYHSSQGNANSGNNPLPENYNATDGETISVRVENIATGCYNTTQFNIYVHPRPDVEIPDQVICVDVGPLLVSANTNNPDDTYIWSTNETTPEIEITEIGTYSVTVTTIFGCETTQVFDVTESASASIDVVETIDFSDPNNITVTISGIGNYLYSLDGSTPQESNFFDNVPMGYHTLTIIDLNGCAEVIKEVLVIDYPNFMTPNNDGYFDTWHIVGIETLPGSTVYIYDRYGKQLAFLTSTDEGWDGTYNGNRMPSTDYWFVADIKRGDIQFQVKGHFALKQ